MRFDFLVLSETTDSVEFLDQTGLDPFTVNPKPVPSLGEGTGLYNYNGCYGDNPANGRVLRALTYSGPEVTPAYCSELCWAYGYTYAGVEYGHECYVSCTITPSFVSTDMLPV